MEVARAGAPRRRGDDFTLLMDPVGVVTPAKKPSKWDACWQDLNFVAFEDPLPTTDIDGLAELVPRARHPDNISASFCSRPTASPSTFRRGAPGRGTVHRGQRGRHHWAA